MDLKIICLALLVTLFGNVLSYEKSTLEEVELSLPFDKQQDAMKDLERPLDVDDIPGHLKPLGSNMEPMQIDIVDVLPDSLEFFDKFVKPSRPVLFRGAAKKMPSFENWRQDSYLQKNYGKWKVDIEVGKKETRSGELLTKSFDYFINHYQKSDYYLVSDIVHPNPLTKEVFIPKPLMCNELAGSIFTNVLWFSSGGTKSVLHTDSSENVNCLFDGWKELYMAHKKHTDLIELVEAGSYSKVDVDRVDMIKFPKLSRVPWYYTKMEAGDCLYIPYKWFHHVKSSNSRNLAVNVWWYYMLDLPRRKNCENDEENLEYKSLNDVTPHSDDEKKRSILLDVFDNEDEPVTSDRFYDCLFRGHFEQHLGENFTKTLTDTVFDSVDDDGDGLISFSDLVETNLSNLRPLYHILNLQGMDLYNEYEEVVDQAKDEL